MMKYYGGANVAKKHLAAFNLHRTHCAMVSFRNKALYVTGGNDRFKSSQSVFWYSIEDDAWYKAAK